MHGKTAGIIGTGKIAKILIQILRGFGMNVLAYDLYPDYNFAREHQVVYCTLDELYHSSDIISLHCPLTEQTKYLINDYSISKMKDGVMIINTGRGQLIHTNALIEGLKTKKVGYAGLDVYEEEEPYFYKRYKSVWEPKTRVSINMKDTRRNSRKRRSRRRTNQHKLSVLVITGVIFLMTALVVVGGISLRAKEKSYLAQETELKKQIDEEKARSQEIDDMEAYVGTDEYVEEIAKEKLGLVNENEIILKAK